MASQAGIGSIHNIILDVSELDRAAAFWTAVLGGRETFRNETYLGLQLDDGSYFVFQKVPESKTEKNRMHFDIAVPDVDEAMEQIVSLGGKLVRGHESTRYRSVIAADPDGNEFCLGTEQGWAFVKG